MRRGHYGCLLSLDKRSYFDISTLEQMLVEAKEKISGRYGLSCSPSINERLLVYQLGNKCEFEAEGRTSRIQDGGPLWGHAGKFF